MIIGISKYNKIKDDEDDNANDLPGVCEDIKTYRNLWEKEYNYKVYPESNKSKWYNKETWTVQEIKEYIEEGRELLFEKREKKHDVLIVIIGGHGGKNNVIYSSEWDKISIKKLHAKVDGKWKIKASEIPRLFVVDCCRGSQESGAVKIKDEVPHRGFESVHQDDLLCTLYGNSPGIAVDDGDGDGGGGTFSVCLIDELKTNAIEKKEYTLSKIARKANKKLKEKSKNGQILSKEGDSEMDTLVFVPK